MTEKNKKIDELFPDGKTVSALKITEYLDWAAHPEEYSQVLAIPPIQRGFVWKPKQIQDLWDSLLRGMPIGSVLLKTTGKGEENAGLSTADRKVEKSSKSGFQLMDGQQRTLAMLLGFPSEEKAQHKLWIDFSESGKGGSSFQFRVSTEAQPFGFSTDGARLSLDDRRKARSSWDRNNEERKKKTNLDIFNNEATMPWKAGSNKQEYLFEVKVVWEWLKDQEILDWVKTIKNKINKNDIEENIINQRIDGCQCLQHTEFCGARSETHHRIWWWRCACDGREKRRTGGDRTCAVKTRVGENADARLRAARSAPAGRLARSHGSTWR